MLKPDDERKGLHLLSKSLVLLDGFFSMGDAIIMIRSEYTRTWFCRIMLVELFNEFVSMCEVCRGNPLIFFSSTFITHPLGHESNGQRDGQ